MTLPTSSAIPVAIDDLMAALLASGWPTPEPQIVDGFFDAQEADVIIVGDTDTARGDDGSREWFTFGSKLEEFTIALDIYCNAGYATAKEARERAFELFDEVWQRAQSTSAVVGSTDSDDEVFELEHSVLQPKYRASFREGAGHTAHLVSGVVVKARVRLP